MEDEGREKEGEEVEPPSYAPDRIQKLVERVLNLVGNELIGIGANLFLQLRVNHKLLTEAEEDDDAPFLVALSVLDRVALYASCTEVSVPGTAKLQEDVLKIEHRGLWPVLLRVEGGRKEGGYYLMVVPVGKVDMGATKGDA